VSTNSLSSYSYNGADAPTPGGGIVFNLGSRDISVELLYITPDMANRFLELNKHNRKLSQTKVDQVARDIRAGRFKFNGVPIIIDDRPEIVDGQHRLHGVAKAGIAVPMLVVGGVATDVTDTIDTLGKPRSVSDILNMRYQHDDLKNRSYIDGAATLLLIGNGRSSPSKPEVAAFADSIIDQLSEWAAFGKSVQSASQKIVVQRHLTRSAMSASAVGSLCITMISGGASRELLQDFFMRVATGNVADSDVTNIIPLLRRRQSSGMLLGGNGGRSQVAGLLTEFATYITAYNRWVAGEPQQQIKGYSNAVREFSALPAVSRIGA
jgi:hypothetical protein